MMHERFFGDRPPVLADTQPMIDVREGSKKQRWWDLRVVMSFRSRTLS